ncbi:MAG: hypothetical protein ACK4FJ_18640 [Ferrovibrio sp.]|uniref:hypothetical protein n=1 Tax=Ferrovibrio sp. TaxID=1917215 RepID=UPI003919FA87
MFEVIYELCQWALAGFGAWKLWKLRDDCAGGFAGVWAAIDALQKEAKTDRRRIETAFSDINFCARKHNEAVEEIERLNAAVFGSPKTTNEDPHLIVTYEDGTVEHKAPEGPTDPAVKVRYGVSVMRPEGGVDVQP